MHVHGCADDYYRDQAHPPGMGPGGHGSGVVIPLPFPDRAAVTRYDDQPGGRGSARPARGFQNGGALQLHNGVSGLARGRLASPVGLFASRATNTNRMVLPGDRAIIPPSPSQIQGWVEATAGSQPRDLGGNGSVVSGWPVGGGVGA